MLVSTQQSDWREVLFCGLENQQIDFKAAQDWNKIGRVGRAKFARHLMALANTLGGYLVIGVGEDPNGNPTLYTGLDEKQASSFDPSGVGQTVNRYAEPAVEFDLVKPEIDGKVYVILVVYPFRNLPHVCNDACEGELQRGVFYVRTPDARSRAAYRSEELHGIIQRALRNQRQMLGRMLRGILYEDRQAVAPSSDQDFAVLLQNARNQAKQLFGNKLWREKPLFEAVIHPQQRQKGITLTDCRRQLEALERPALHDFPWPSAHIRKTRFYASNQAIRGHAEENSQPNFFWEFYPEGLFYCAVALPELPEHSIESRTLLQLCLITLALNGEFFSRLGLSDELLTLFFNLNNTLDLNLLLGEESESRVNVCHIHDIRIKRSRTAGDLEGGAAADTATQFFREMCERFNYSLSEADCQSISTGLEDFLKKGLLDL
ncbi:MAG: ATP-binding protein [Lentisphaeria bacterium]|nr:ATP-binding protein [Lentisphaeria bacterium]NLZ59792.1 ATP-binding protein [Lentisphaerota bacterium]